MESAGDAVDRAAAIVERRLKVDPGADPLALFAEVAAADLDELASEAHRRGQIGLAGRLDGQSAEMDRLAASRPCRQATSPK